MEKQTVAQGTTFERVMDVSKPTFTVDQLFSLLQNQKFFDWYCDGGDYDTWIQLGPEDSGVSEDKLKSWLGKELRKR